MFERVGEQERRKQKERLLLLLTKDMILLFLLLARRRLFLLAAAPLLALLHRVALDHVPLLVLMLSQKIVALLVEALLVLGPSDGRRDMLFLPLVVSTVIVVVLPSRLLPRSSMPSDIVPASNFARTLLETRGGIGGVGLLVHRWLGDPLLAGRVR